MTASSPPRPAVPLACRVLLAVAARVAPPAVRRDWRREWQAEVASALIAHPRRCTGGSMTLRGLGALVHAAWLRWDQWRPELVARDFAHALRMLARRPGHAAIVVLTLGLGIGANAAIFGAVHAVLLRPLPFPEPKQLVQVHTTSLRSPAAPGGTVSPPDFTDWRRDARVFRELSAFTAISMALTGRGPAEQVPCAAVTGGFFDVIGVRAALGRTLQTDDDPINTPDVVVLSHALWVRRFGGDPAIVGRRAAIDGVSREIVGVMPEGFAYPLEAELWVPLRFTAGDLATQRGAHYLDVIGRLRTGATVETARAEMRTLAARLAAAHPRTNRDAGAAVSGLRDALVGEVRPALLVLLGAVGFVLLIACVNVSGLVLAQALGRSRELAIRLAVGAGRGQLLRGLFAESFVLAAGGGAAGLLLAWWGVAAIAAMEGSLQVPRLDQARLDLDVLLFTAVVTLGTAVLFGMLPAWHASTTADVARRIRETGGAAGGRQRLRSALVIAETALAVVLLVSAGLLARSFARLMAVDPGFAPDGVQTFSVSLPEAAYTEPARRAAFVETMLARARGLPDVEAAGAIFGLPLTGFGYLISTSALDGRRLEPEDQDRLSVQLRVATPGYFEAMRIRLLRGRSFQDADRAGAPLVAVVNESAARLLWPGDDPIGRTLALGTRLSQGGARAGGEVIGLVGDVHDRGPSSNPRPTVFVAHAQFPVDYLTFVVRSRAGPSAVVQTFGEILAERDPELPLFRVRSMAAIAAEAVAQPRAYRALLGAFAATAIMLSAIGLYGVLASSVSQRTREIGIRIALGAGRGAVVGQVVGRAATIALAGATIGLLASAAAGRVLTRFLFGITHLDAATYAAVAGATLAVALAASWLPARRAARVDPMQAMRLD